MKSHADIGWAIGAGIGALVLVCGSCWAAPFSSTYLFDTPTDTPTLAGVSFSPFTRVGVTEVSQAGAFASAGWSEATTEDLTRWVEFTLTPDPGYSVDLTDLSFQAWSKNSAVGPKSGRVEVRLDNEPLNAEPFDFNITSTRTLTTFDFPDFTAAAGQTVAVRFYAWNSLNKNQGELDFDNVTIRGIDPVPEPVNMALAAFGLCFCGFAAYRKVRAR